METSKLILNWTEYYFTDDNTQANWIHKIMLNGNTYNIKQYVWWWQPWADTVAYYKLEQDLNDYSWNNLNLTPASTVTYSSLASGKNVCFFNDSASISSFPALTGDITVVLWVKNKSNYTWYNWVWYILKWNSWDDAGCTALVFSWNSQSNGLRWQPTWSLISRPTVFTDTNWHLIICTYNKNTQDSNVYLDGNTIPLINFTNTSSASPSASVFYLCKYSSQKDTYLSDVIIESKVWTADEISAHFNSTKSLYGIS